jgi:hypothetical protein
MRALLRYFLFFFALFQLGNIYSQSNEFAVKNKHHISPTFSFYYFYDTAPIINRPHQMKIAWFTNVMGISYENICNTKSGWATSLDFYYFVNQENTNQMKQGTVFSRQFNQVQGHYQRFIIKNEKFSIKGTIGLSLRFGSESILENTIAGGPYLAIFLLDRGLIDLGVPIGIESTYYFWKHFHLKARLSHTFFPYVYSKKNPYYSWDQGPPRNMSNLTFGLGVNF